MQFMNLQGKGSRLTWNLEIDYQKIRDTILSAIFFIFSYAPSPFGFFIYFAFIPQFNLYLKLTPKQAFLTGYILGIIVNSGVLYWIIPYSFTAYIWVVLLNSVQFAVFALIFTYALKLRRVFALLAFPFLWTFIEYTRQIGEIAFNWLSIAHTQTYFLALIQYVEFTGHLGVVFWICLINLLLYAMWNYRSDFRKMGFCIGLLLLLFIIPFIFGLIKLSEKPGLKGISVGYVQPNIDPVKKWSAAFQKKNIKVLSDLTDSLMIYKPDLVIWPETAIPYDLQSEQKDLEFLINYSAQNRIYLLTGTLDYITLEDKKAKFNAALLFSSDNDPVKVYHKMMPVPFEEKIPFSSFLGDIDFGVNYLSAGDHATVFELFLRTYYVHFNGSDWYGTKKTEKEENVKFGTVICFESLFPNLVRRFFRSDAQILTVITNDAWFEYTAQPYQHIQIAIFRAIENRSAIIQCANSGISGFIDPYGRIFDASDIFTTRYAQKIIPLRIKATIYTKFGDTVGIICGIVLITFVLLTILSNLAFIKNRIIRCQ